MPKEYSPVSRFRNCVFSSSVMITTKSTVTARSQTIANKIPKNTKVLQASLSNSVSKSFLYLNNFRVKNKTVYQPKPKIKSIRIKCKMKSKSTIGLFRLNRQNSASALHRNIPPQIHRLLPRLFWLWLFENECCKLQCENTLCQQTEKRIRASIF